jgi:hypothetical protein
VTANLLGPMRTTAALPPVPLKQPRATLLHINTSSGLAFVPLAMIAGDCARRFCILHSISEVSTLAYVGSGNRDCPAVRTDATAGRARHESESHATRRLRRRKQNKILTDSPMGPRFSPSAMRFGRSGDCDGRRTSTKDSRGAAKLARSEQELPRARPTSLSPRG